MKKAKKVLRPKSRIKPKECYLCKEKKEPMFSNTEIFYRFLSERGRIQPRARSGLCAKHQKSITLNIKYARHLSLLPFVPR